MVRAVSHVSCGVLGTVRVSLHLLVMILIWSSISSWKSLDHSSSLIAWAW